MSEASSQYFTEVLHHLSELGQPVAMTADERDIVDDYAAQDFGAEACASYITQHARSRRSDQKV